MMYNSRAIVHEDAVNLTVSRIIEYFRNGHTVRFYINYITASTTQGHNMCAVCLNSITCITMFL